MATTTFTCKSRTDSWFYLAAAVLLNCFTLFFAWIFFSHAAHGSLLFGLFVLVFWGIFSAQFLITSLSRLKYQKIDGGKTLVLDKENRQLLVTCKNYTYAINNADIKDFEIYRS